MEALLAIFVSKVISPDLILIGVAAGLFAWRWWQVAVCCLAAVVVHAFLLAVTQATNQFSPGAFAIALVATALWSIIGRRFRRRQRPR